MAATGERHGPILPNAPSSLPADAQKTWDETMRILTKFHGRVHWGQMATGYNVTGQVSVSASIDLNTPNVTAVAQCLGKLIWDLKSAGYLVATVVSAP
jgi:hypothetical protein